MGFRARKGEKKWSRHLNASLDTTDTGTVPEGAQVLELGLLERAQEGQESNGDAVGCPDFVALLTVGAKVKANEVSFLFPTVQSPAALKSEK